MYFHGFMVFLLQEAPYVVLVATVGIWEIKLGRKGSAACWVADFLMPKDISPFAKASLGISLGMSLGMSLQQPWDGAAAWKRCLGNWVKRQSCL